MHGNCVLKKVKNLKLKMSVNVSKSEDQGGKHTKNKQKELKDALNLKDIDEVLEKVRAVDYKCTFATCKNKTQMFSIDCKFCNGRYCSTHGLPEIHGCGEAVKKEEKRKFLHPDMKLSQQKRSEVQSKLSMKLKQIQSERKPKGTNKDKKK